MNYKVLYRKYRPNNFDNIVGQEYIVKTLKNSIKSNKISHAYIFSGPRGTGKTSTAKVFAKTINCLNSVDGNSCDKCSKCLEFNDNPDVIEIDAASNNGVNEIRELKNSITVLPTNSKYKIYIIDEFHMITTEAFNALLKTLEEPPSHVIFIMATTDIQKVPITILSRCQRFDFKKLTVDDIFSYLKKVSKLENIKITDEALKEISYISDGGMRDALSVLDQLNNVENREITLNDVNNLLGNVSTQTINNLANSLIDNNKNDIFNIIKELNNKGTDYKVFIEKLILKLKDEALKYKFDNNNIEIFDKLKNLMFELVNKMDSLKNLSNPYIVIEMILLSYVNLNQEKNNKKEEKNEKKEEKPEKTQEKIEKEEKAEENNKEILKNDSKIEKKELNLGNKVEKNNKIISREIILNRINNCFCNANRQKRDELIKLWHDFISYVEKNNKEILSIIIDSNIVAASNDYAIITVDDEVQSNLLNQKIIKVEKVFKKFSKLEYKFITITNEAFAKEKKQYATNIKNNVKYELKEDLMVENNINNKESDLEKTAIDLFSEDILEIR